MAEQVAGVEPAAILGHGRGRTTELDYSEALDAFGLRFKPSPQAADRAAKAWLGTTTRNDNGRLVVTQVQRGSPADVAGINVDDEILAIDDFRVRADRFENRLEQYRPGDKVSMLVARREQLLQVDVTLGVEPAELAPGGEPERDGDAAAERSTRGCGGARLLKSNR